MNRTPVVSTNVKAIGYDAATLTLEIEFHAIGEPRVYFYAPVTAERHALLMSPGASIGRIVGSLKCDPSITCERVDTSDIQFVDTLRFATNEF